MYLLFCSCSSISIFHGFVISASDLFHITSNSFVLKDVESVLCVLSLNLTKLVLFSPCHCHCQFQNNSFIVGCVSLFDISLFDISFLRPWGWIIRQNWHLFNWHFFSTKDQMLFYLFYNIVWKNTRPWKIPLLVWHIQDLFLHY